MQAKDEFFNPQGTRTPPASSTIGIVNRLERARSPSIKKPGFYEKLLSKERDPRRNPVSDLHKPAPDVQHANGNDINERSSKDARDRYCNNAAASLISGFLRDG